jgi:hypothetical protein
MRAAASLRGGQERVAAVRLQQAALRKARLGQRSVAARHAAEHATAAHLRVRAYCTPQATRASRLIRHAARRRAKQSGAAKSARAARASSERQPAARGR